jgi:peptidoglycan/xylan/chitin deacetylase (PgdA/CDA1 family)
MVRGESEFCKALDAASCPRIPNWPDGKKFALVLTHDVETADGLERCMQLAEMEERLGFRSSFNFVAGDYTVPTELRQHLTDRGFEIGVHGLHHDQNPFRSESIFKKQSVEINRTLKEWGAVGFRSPSMYHDLEMLRHLDIEYDASTFDTDPFEPQPDGMSTIFPFWVPNRDIQEDALVKSPLNGHTGESRYPELLKDTGFRVKPGMTTEANCDSLRNRQKGYVELPYTLPQDFLLFVLMHEKNIDIWKKKLDWIADQGGMALFIAHPGYMRFNDAWGYDGYPVSYYEEFLKYIKSKYEGQYRHALPRDVARFWAGKNRVPTPAPLAPKPLPLPSRLSLPLTPNPCPLHACMLVYSFYESDNRVMRYAEALVKRGDSVDVIALGKEGTPRYEEIRGVKVYRIQKRMIDEKGKISYLLKLIAFLFNLSG